MSLREALEVAVRGGEVPAPLLADAFEEILGERATPVAMAGLLVALRCKGETVAEIVAVARVLRAHAISAACPDPRTLDTCGTGGDGAETFNISTAAAFVVAGAGVPVAKHGNRAASGRAGSIDVLEALGVRVELSVEESLRILQAVGIAPFFARSAHPALRVLAPVRKELGIRTLMNCLGPLLNPLGVRRQLIGVYAESLVEPLAHALQQLGAERALVVHGSDGLDEITTTGPSVGALCADGRIERLRIEPLELGIARAEAADLKGGDAVENAAILRGVLAGEAGPRRDIVLLNAAAALWAGGAAPDLTQGLGLAHHSLDSGAARQRLEALIAESRR